MTESDFFRNFLYESSQKFGLKRVKIYIPKKKLWKNFLQGHRRLIIGVTCDLAQNFSQDVKLVKTGLVMIDEISFERISAVIWTDFQNKILLWKRVLTSTNLNLL